MVAKGYKWSGTLQVLALYKWKGVQVYPLCFPDGVGVGVGVKVLQILVFCELLALSTIACEAKAPKKSATPKEERGSKGFHLRNGKHECTCVLGALSGFCICEALPLAFP